jgi:KUP system potassium uptake protein
MCLTVALTIGFGSSDRLAGAYGAAVSTTMVLTTALLYQVMCRTWRWSAARAAAIAGVLLTVDLAFFLANLFKVEQGGWIPLLFGALVFGIMTTWHYGLDALHRRSMARSQHVDAFFADLREQNIARVPGTAIFLTRLNHRIPPIIVDYVRQAHSLHQTTIALTASFESVPRIRSADRIRCEPLGEGLWHISVHFGFVEIPDLPTVLANARQMGVPIQSDATYYIERHDPVSRSRRNPIARFQIALFAFMARNSAHAIDRFRLPRGSLVEIGSRMEI